MGYVKGKGKLLAVMVEHQAGLRLAIASCAKSIPLPHEGLSRGAGGSAKRCPAADSLAACPRRNSSSCDWGGGQGQPWGAVCGLQGPLGDPGLQARHSLQLYIHAP